MKIRNGFVSNSSSSSFIVPKDLEKQAISFGLRLVPVKQLKEIYRKIDQKVKEIEELDNIVSGDLGLYFMSIEMGGSLYLPYSLKDFDEMIDEDFITMPMDRDYACRQGIDEQFELFRGDI